MTHPTNHSRSLIRITGDDRVSFLQGIVTNDVAKLATDKIQFAALLSPQGKILHDMFLIAADDSILIDTQTAYKDTLLKRLAMYKMRAKVVIEEVTSSDHAIIQAIGILPDTRHRDLSPRDYTSFPSHESLAPSPLSLGIPELGRDFLPDAITALDAGYDLLHAVSFTKGCYVGQEVTARMHYKNIARRGFFILTHATLPTRLALLKFEDVYSHEAAAPFTVVVDNIAYQATLPAWMLPKLAQFEANEKNQ